MGYLGWIEDSTYPVGFNNIFIDGMEFILYKCSDIRTTVWSITNDDRLLLLGVVQYAFDNFTPTCVIRPIKL